MKKYDIKINGKAFDVGIESVNPDMSAKIVVNGKEFLVQLSEEREPSVPSSTISSDAVISREARTAEHSTAESLITSPLPGVIIGLNVKEGDMVKAGQCLATLEAMKMENAIEAERSGTVKKIFVRKGDSILEGAKIILIG